MADLGVMADFIHRSMMWREGRARFSGMETGA